MKLLFLVFLNYFKILFKKCYYDYYNTRLVSALRLSKVSLRNSLVQVLYYFVHYLSLC